MYPYEEIKFLLLCMCSAEILTDISEKAFYEVTSADGSDSCFPLELLAIDVICHLGSCSEWVLSQKQCFLVIRTAVRLP